jgi:hypothetical protein
MIIKICMNAWRIPNSKNWEVTSFSISVIWINIKIDFKLKLYSKQPENLKIDTSG